MMGRPPTTSVQTKSAQLRCEGKCPPSPGRKWAITDHKFTHTDTGESRDEHGQAMPIGYVWMRCTVCGQGRVWGSFRTKEKQPSNFTDRERVVA